MRRRAAAAVIAAVLGTVVLGACGADSAPLGRASARGSDAPVETAHPNFSLVAYGGQFLTSCPFTHTLADDPIVHRGHPGASHQHEFFGNVSTDASSTYASMIHKPSTCSDDGDRSGYWVPALFVDGTRVQPRRVDAYYRVADGVKPTAVRPFPDGLEVLAGDQFSTKPEPLEVAAWACGLSPEVSHTPPKDCTRDRPVQLRLTYPSCWDGKHIRSADHESHLSYPSAEHGCDAAHPVAVPQLTLTVHYPLWGTYSRARLASGNFDTAHGDFLAAWQDKRIDDQVKGCLNRSVTCGIVGGTFHTGRGSGDENSYNVTPAPDGPTTLPVYDHGVTTTTMDPAEMRRSMH